MTRVLFVTPVSPNPRGSGSQQRAFHTLHALSGKASVFLLVVAKRSHVLPVPRPVAGMCERTELIPLDCFSEKAATVRALMPQWLPALFGALGRRTQEELFTSRWQTRVVSKLLVNTSFDAVHIFRLFAVPPVEPFLAGFSGHVQLDLDDWESRVRGRLTRRHVELGQRRLARYWSTEQKKYEALERRWLPRFHRVFAASSEDRTSLENCFPYTAFSVLPNVVTVARKAKPADSRSLERTFLFVGDFGYFPNRDGIFFFLRNVWTRLRGEFGENLRLRLAGKGITKKTRTLLEQFPGTDIRGEVEDIGSAYDGAAAALIPLFVGGGTRIKALEAFAFGVPVIATSIGIEGIPVQNGVHALVADTADEMVGACRRLLANAELSARLAENAAILVQASFRLERLREALSEDDFWNDTAEHRSR